MTYRPVELEPAFNHDNRRILMHDHGAQYFDLDELCRLSDQETVIPLQKFDDLWTDLGQCLQAPVLSNDERLSGYTGYRTVIFRRGIGQAALGFNLLKNSSMHQRVIVAERRKIYPVDRRRRHYEYDRFSVETEDIRDNPRHPELRRNLDKLRIWADMFLAEQPLDPLIYSPVDSISNPV